jgi:hypothetical protein
MKFETIPSPSPFVREEASYTTRGKEDTNASKTKLKHVRDCERAQKPSTALLVDSQAVRLVSALLCPAPV